jgi:hypothetical protein
MRHWLVAALLMSLSSVTQGIEPVTAVRGEAAAPAPVPEAAAPKPQLRFRGKGPICLCSTGLSESDIQQATRTVTKAKPAENAAEPQLKN